MSLFHTEAVACPFCGATAEHEIANSVAAARRPDLRAAILDDSMQRTACDACGAAFRIAPSLTYMDVERGDWFLTLPCADRPFWDAFERGALDIFNDSFGLTAPQAARGLGERLRVRVCFGWTGLREKLLCEEYGIDDVALELTKLLLMRTSEAAHIAEDTVLRLIGKAPDGSLLMSWLRTSDEGGEEAIAVPAALLDSIAADPAWNQARAELANGPFVDVTKMLVEPELPVPA